MTQTTATPLATPAVAKAETEFHEFNGHNLNVFWIFLSRVF